MADQERIELRRGLDILIALTLCQLEKRNEPADIIAVLGRFNIQPREIAALLGMTSNAAGVALHRSRQKVRPHKRKIKK